jgi:hypothetical protein
MMIDLCVIVCQKVAPRSSGDEWIDAADNCRIRRVGPDGIITTYAGTGACGFGGDGGPATAALFSRLLRGLALGPDGNVYVGDANNHRVRTIAADGIVSTVAGNGQRGFSGEGGPATLASLAYPWDVDLLPDSSLLIADAGNNRVRMVDPGGIIRTVAGSGGQGFSGDGGPAVAAKYWRVRRVHPSLPALSPSGLTIVSEDGAEVYVFSPEGRHFQTRNALTGGAEVRVLVPERRPSRRRQRCGRQYDAGSAGTSVGTLAGVVVHPTNADFGRVLTKTGECNIQLAIKLMF